MKKIPLTRGYFAIVDDEDFEKVNAYKWYCMTRRHHKYAAKSFRVNGVKTVLQMHRFVLNLFDSSKMIDHINGNGLDNRKENIRICTASDNAKNKILPASNKSGFKGVCWHKRDKKFYAQIKVNNKMQYLGVFDCPIEAAKAYNIGALKHHGQFARLNTIPQ